MPPHAPSEHFTFQPIEPDSTDFARVLALRELAYGKPIARNSDPIDAHSFHVGAFIGGTLQGAIRLTFRRYGPLECEQHYPQEILDDFGVRLGAASRLCIHPSLPRFSELPVQLATEGWRLGIAHGIRVDITKARIRAIPFYLRLGYRFLRHSFFFYEATQVPCSLIVYPANPEHPGRFSSLFQDIETPCRLEDHNLTLQLSSSYRDVMEDYQQFCHLHQLNEKECT